MNYIQENAKSVRFYTSLLDVEKWLDIRLENYDWHIADIDGAWPELDDPCWIKGEDLKAKLDDFDYQFVWAVLSAYPKGSKKFLSDKPYADGNPEFWQGSPQKQLKDALFEIVCWDSGATLFIGLPLELGDKLIKNAPGIKDLDKENEQRNC